MINSVSTKLISQLNINIANIPAKNLPNSFLKKYSRDVLANTTLSNIIELSTLSKILPGINKNDLASIPYDNKINSLVNMLNTSKLNEIDLTSYQVIIYIKYKSNQDIC